MEGRGNLRYLTCQKKLIGHGLEVKVINCRKEYKGKRVETRFPFMILSNR
jgi:hypothetical protein